MNIKCCDNIEINKTFYGLKLADNKQNNTNKCKYSIFMKRIHSVNVEDDSKQLFLQRTYLQLITFE